MMLANGESSGYFRMDIEPTSEESTVPTPTQIHNRFTYHAASPETRKVHELVAELTEALGNRIIESTEESAQQVLTLTSLEDVRMRWNQAVALDGQGFGPLER